MVTGIGTGEDAPVRAVKAWDLFLACTEELVRQNDDGFGYAALRPDGAVFGERWLDVKRAWRVRGRSRLAADLEGAMDKQGYSRFGEWTGEAAWPQMATLLGHARRSTNNVCMANVHPFVRVTNDAIYSLVHNGVVSKTGLDCSGSNECDSAGILNAYVDADMAADFEHAQTDFFDKLDGSYVCGVLVTPRQAGAFAPFVDIFRGGTAASLDIIDVPEIGVIWCTDGSIPLTELFKRKLAIAQTGSLKEGVHLRFDAMTGGLVFKRPFVRATVTPISGSTTSYTMPGNVGHTAHGRKWDSEAKHGKTSSLYEGRGYSSLYAGPNADPDAFKQLTAKGEAKLSAYESWYDQLMGGEGG
jgi:hypothetical protein